MGRGGDLPVHLIAERLRAPSPVASSPVLRRYSDPLRDRGRRDRKSEPQVPPRVVDAVTSSGEPLDLATRATMERRLAHDFSRVRVHKDAAAHESAAAVGARSYTVGTDIVFGRGEFEPHTESGRHVLAHELAHVIQQGDRAATDIGSIRMGRSSDPAEAEAARIATGLSTGVTRSTGGAVLQRVPPEPGTGGTTKGHTEVVEELERRRFFTPAGARVTDTRPAILPEDRASVDKLVAFMEKARTEVQNLLAGAGPKDAWLTDQNANINEVLSLIGQLIMDIRGSNIIIRFDQAAGAVAAHYDYGENLIHVSPVPDDNALSIVVPSLLHEYAHAIQDRAAAAATAKAAAPQEHTREAELKQETDARRVDVYAASLLFATKLGPTDPQAALDAVFSSAGFRYDFERVRTGNAAERKAGAAAVRKRLEGPYAAQLAANAPSMRYPIEIDSGNHAVLMARGAAGAAAPTRIDLGAVPAGVTTRAQLVAHLIQAIQGLAQFASLFVGPGTKRYVIASFVVFFKNVDGLEEIVAQFSLGPPAAPAAPAAVPPGGAAPAGPPPK